MSAHDDDMIDAKLHFNRPFVRVAKKQMKFTLESVSMDATATEGWSGVQDRDLDGIKAAVAWFAAEVIEAPYARHFLRVAGQDQIVAQFDPPQ